MSTIEIAKETVPWDALATLSVAIATVVAGGLAVFAAFRVGQKQSEISLRQVEIIGRQLSLQEISLRAELYDRRVVLYDATKAFLTEIMRRAEHPDGEILNNFLNAVDKSRFLFGLDVSNKLEEIRKRAVDLWLANTQLHEGGLHRGEDRTNMAELKKTTLLYIYDQLSGLPELMASHMTVDETKNR